eukprot:516398-Amphidinium_carterae.1
MVCKWNALNAVRLSERHSGHEVYRMLLKRCDPQTKTRALVRLSRIVNPQSQPDALMDLNHFSVQWEREIQGMRP